MYNSGTWFLQSDCFITSGRNRCFFASRSDFALKDSEASISSFFWFRMHYTEYLKLILRFTILKKQQLMLVLIILFQQPQSAPVISIVSFHLFPKKAAKYSSSEPFQIASAIQNISKYIIRNNHTLMGTDYTVYWVYSIYNFHDGLTYAALICYSIVEMDLEQIFLHRWRFPVMNSAIQLYNQSNFCTLKKKRPLLEWHINYHWIKLVLLPGL